MYKSIIFLPVLYGCLTAECWGKCSD